MKFKDVFRRQVQVAFGDSPVCTVSEIKGQFALSNMIWQFKLKDSKPKKYKESNY